MDTMPVMKVLMRDTSEIDGASCFMKSIGFLQNPFCINSSNKPTQSVFTSTSLLSSTAVLTGVLREEDTEGKLRLNAPPFCLFLRL